MADLRAVVKGIMQQYGHDVYLLRRGPDVDNGPYPGPTYANKLERHTVRNMLPGSSTGLGHVLQEADAGLRTDVDLVFWFLWDVNPKEGDIIYEELPQSKKGGDGKLISSTYGSSWVIDYAYPFRGIGGRVEYWGCGATKDEPD